MGISENKEQKKIVHNLDFLKWYLETKPEDFELEYKSEEKTKELFLLFTECIYEDPFVFMRLILYIANTRTEVYQEFIYKTLLHYIGILSPQFVLSNIDMLINFGYKSDILYLLSVPNIQKRIIKYIEHKSKVVNEFKTLLEGKMIEKIRTNICTYEIKNPVSLLETILDDASLNGISI